MFVPTPGALSTRYWIGNYTVVAEVDDAAACIHIEYLYHVAYGLSIHYIFVSNNLWSR